MTPPLPRLAAWLLRISVPERWAGSIHDDFEADWQQRCARTDRRRQRAAITTDALIVAIGFWREWWSLTCAAVRRDVDDAARSVWRRPRHALAAGAVIAAGVGINTAAFAIVDRVLLRPLPYHEPGRLVQLAARDDKDGISRTVSSVDVEAWKDALDPIAAIAAYQVETVSVQGDAEFPDRVPAARVTPSLFTVLGRPPIIGRDFSDRDGRMGMPGAAIISYDLWRSLFSGRASIEGERVLVDGQSYTITGVAPPGVEFPPGVGLWLARETAGARLRNLNIEFASLQTVARLANELPIESVQAEIDARAWASRRGPLAIPLHDAIVGTTRRGLELAWAAVLILFLIACANSAALLLARAASRKHELSVRAALGAGRAALMRCLAAEGAIIAGAAGLAGLAIAFGLIKLFVVVEAERLPRAAGVQLDAPSLVFAVGLTIAAAATAMTAARAINAPTRWRRPEGGALVAFQLALSVVLLTGAGVTGAALIDELRQHPGFDPREVVVVTVQPRASMARESSASAAYGPVLDRLAGIYGVESVAMSDHVPPDAAGNIAPIIIEGETAMAAERADPVRIIGVTDRYLSLMRIPVVGGRGFSANDMVGGRAVAVIDTRVAARMGGAAAVGRRLLIGGKPHEIVGIAAAARQGAPQAPAEPTLYRPLGSGAFAHGPATFLAELHVLVRSRENAGSVIPAVKAAVASAPGAIEPRGLSRLTARLSAVLAAPMLATMVFSSFAVVGLSITVLGIYGLLSIVLQQSIPGIGVRLALGASRRRIAAELLRDALGTASAGVAIGLLVSPLVAAAIVERIGGAAPGAGVYAAIAASLLVIVAAACAAPVRRAMRIDPIRTLRCE
jgi:putative ABC transport system permease protein